MIERRDILNNTIILHDEFFQILFVILLYIIMEEAVVEDDDKIDELVEKTIHSTALSAQWDKEGLKGKLRSLSTWRT